MAELTATILHEQASKSFRRTPHGLIFSEDIRVVYSVFLICLNLQDVGKVPKKGFFPFQKTIYPFSFTVNDAVNTMKHLELQLDISVTCISISYTIQPEMACYLLELFMTAKLLHTPADRTRALPKDKVLMQPTPKGVAVLQKYVRDVGLKNVPDILTSSFNSMELFTFERSSEKDCIIHSDYLMHILFITMMGESPNVWSPSMQSDKIPSLSKLLECSCSNEFSFENFQFANGGHLKTPKSEEYNWRDRLSQEKLNDENRTSPFAHKFFTNPDSDSHIQYYTSNCGLRLFESKTFGPNQTPLDYSFTTKAIWQWLMDCTDIMYPKEAISIAALFLKAGLIIPIVERPSHRTRFFIGKSCHYTFSRRGWDMCQWNFNNDTDKSNDSSFIARKRRRESHFLDNLRKPKNTPPLDSTPSDSEKTVVSPDPRFKEFDDILNDPGMRYLFRKHLENEFCVENLDAFFEIRKFLRKVTLLEKLNNSRRTGATKKGGKGKVSDIKAVIDSALVKQANECLEIGYHIYSSYISVGSPYQLNIDHSLRESISQIMLKPKVPSSKRFSFKIDVQDIVSLTDQNWATNRNQVSPLRELQPAVLCESVPESRTKRTSVATSVTKLSDPLSRGREEIPPDIKACNNPFISEAIEHDALSAATERLRKLFPLFETLKQNLYRLMKIDSLQKFLTSTVYQEGVVLAGL
ncbi:SST2 (YLR452C) [Zygosaccharomyces parabailii]|nr:SST2 (YLR452C) [Zygosaccharomyces parabailii]CDH09247.1 related to Protein SST2 [Zygosaccharomyces bailii ISA1307]